MGAALRDWAILSLGRYFRREVTIEPGLRIVAEEGWTPRTPQAALEEKIREALAALNNGGAT